MWTYMSRLLGLMDLFGMAFEMFVKTHLFWLRDYFCFIQKHDLNFGLFIELVFFILLLCSFDGISTVTKANVSYNSPVSDTRANAS